MENKLTINRILEITIPALIVFAVSWGIYTTKSNAQGEEIKDLKEKYQTIVQITNDIKLDVGNVKKDTEYLIKALDRHIGK